jgi:hypothetical protein
MVVSIGLLVIEVLEVATVLAEVIGLVAALTRFFFSWWRRRERRQERRDEPRLLPYPSDWMLACA